MANEQKIAIGNRILTREEVYKEKEQFRKKRSMQSFEDKIKALVELQKIAYHWGRKKDITIWKL